MKPGGAPRPGPVAVEERLQGRDQLGAVAAVVVAQRVQEPGGEGAAHVVRDERQQQHVRGQLLVPGRADAAGAGGGDPAGVPGLLQGAAQPLRRVDGRADAQRDPVAVAQPGGERKTDGVQEFLGDQALGSLAVRLLAGGRPVGGHAGQRDQRHGLLAEAGHRDPVGRLRARGVRRHQDLLQERLGRLPAARARTLGGGDHHLPVRGGTEPGQQYGGGDPQPGRDLGRGGARLDQFQHLPGEPAAVPCGPPRAGRVRRRSAG